jgi:phenylalanyl-tRNA synthetase beta chain
MVGMVGEVHPSVAERLDIPSGTALFELDLTALAAEATDRVTYREISRYPPVHRDLAFILDESVPAGAIADAIAGIGGDLVESVILFDVFHGDPIPKGKKSLAFSVDFRAPDRTLTDEEVEAVVRTIVQRVSSEQGGQLRAG